VAAHQLGRISAPRRMRIQDLALHQEGIGMVKVLPHVMRTINEFNITLGDEYGYKILYFGINLILMHEYKLSFSIGVKKSDCGERSNSIETLIISRRNVLAWKKTLGIITRI
jgi:hypothetical protein